MVGKITDAIGLTDNAGKEKAAKSAQQAADRSYALTEEQVKFNREQYADWKNIYGDVQENLGDYYKNLGADKIMSLGLTANQQEYQTAKTTVVKELAQKGLKGSGIEAAVISNAEFSNANARATIRSTAEDVANEKKLAFLGIGLGQGAAFLGGVNSAYGTGVAGASAIAGQQTQLQSQLAQANMETMGSVVGTAAGYFKKK